MELKVKAILKSRRPAFAQVYPGLYKTRGTVIKWTCLTLQSRPMLQSFCKDGRICKKNVPAAGVQPGA
jgi:hypothetical protein